jgi:hypothetical protein
MGNGLCSRNYKEKMKITGKTRYGGYRHAGWDDTTSWYTIGLIVVVFFINVLCTF